MFRPFLTIDVIALIFLASSLVLTLKLKKLMGKGKDTGPVKILLIVAAINIILGALLLAGGYSKYIGSYIDYVRLTDISLMAIGIILTGSVWKVYTDYKKIIKKHEPDE